MIRRERDILECVGYKCDIFICLDLFIIYFVARVNGVIIFRLKGRCGCSIVYELKLNAFHRYVHWTVTA